MERNKYIIASKGPVTISQIINDCESTLCVHTSKGESLSSVLNKLCRRIETVANTPTPIIGDGDERVKVSSNDTTKGYLNGKLVAGSNIILTENNDGSSETLTISAIMPDIDIDYQMSITADGSGLKLINDELAPGNREFYSTDGSGIKGWRFLEVADIPSLTGLYWSLLGNSGTNPATNFIGTTGAQDWTIRVNNIYSGGIDRNGGTFFGYQTNNTNPYIDSLNTAFGAFTLFSIDPLNGGDGNVAIGNTAMFSSTEAFNSVAVGYGSAFSNTTGHDIVAIGTNALFSNTTAINSIAIGTNSLFASNGSFNTAVGYFSMRFNTTGSQNSAFGMNALLHNTTGIKSVAVGAGALENATTGGFNVGLGMDSLLGVIDGFRNIGIGWNGGVTSPDGYQNIGIGYRAGNSVNGATAFNNIFIGGLDTGYNVLQKTDAINTIAIGSGAYTTADNQIVLGNSAHTQTQFWGEIILNTLPTNDNTEANVLTINTSTKNVEYRTVASIIAAVPPFVLSNGNGTTANGTAVDLGGSIAGDVAIQASGTEAFHIEGIEDFSVGGGVYTPHANDEGFIGYYTSEAKGWIGDLAGNNNAVFALIDDDLNKIVLNTPTGNLFINDISLGTASNGYVWSLIDNATGEGAWIDVSSLISGFVTSVSGTSNRITSSGGTTPTIDIAATYVGQTSITTLGVITTGTWNGTAITNANLANSTISGIALGGTLANLSATDTTLTFSGTYTGATARTIGINLSNANTWLAAQSVPDDAYNATTWNSNVEVPTKNAVRDKIESLSLGITRTIINTSGSITMGSTVLVDYVYIVTGAHTMSLPSASGNTNRYTVKNNHVAAITVDTAGAENVEGGASISVAAGTSVDLISDNTNWWVI